MWIALQREIGQIGQGCPAAIAVDVATRGVAADDLRDFHIDQVWRVQSLID